MNHLHKKGVLGFMDEDPSQEEARRRRREQVLKLKPEEPQHREFHLSDLKVWGLRPRRRWVGGTEIWRRKNNDEVRVKDRSIMLLFYNTNNETWEAFIYKDLKWF